MSANFYNNSGTMVGVDLHKYWLLAPPPTGTVFPFWPHGVAVGFSNEPSKRYLRTGSITADSELMIAGGFDNGPVVHAPVPAPPHPGELALFWLILKTSTSTAQLTVGSVTGEGNALACCIYGAGGLNVNCNDPLDWPNGVVVCTSSVVTTPTLGDFVYALLSWFGGAVIGFGIGHLLDKLKEAKKLGDRGITIIKTILRLFQDALKALFPKVAWVFEPYNTFLQHVKRAFDWYQAEVERQARKVLGT